MIELRLRFGPEAFEEQALLYLWMLDAEPRVPIYIGESSTSLADRSGLHIRRFGDTYRSGAQLATLITNRQYGEACYLVTAEAVPQQLIQNVINENLHDPVSNPVQMARRALERSLFNRMHKQHIQLHTARACRWSATCADQFLAQFVQDALVGN